MYEEILEVAKTLSGAGEDELQVLSLLCAASQREWAGRLREGVTVQECREAFVVAAAMWAAAGLSGGREGDVTSFRAGDVSVTKGEGVQRAKTLRRQAEELMRPYVTESAFAVRRARG